MNRKKYLALGIPAVLVFIIDQWSKWLIRTSPELQNLSIIDGWLEFYYTQNPGMALGIDVISTPVISSVAILATIGILVYVLMGAKEATTGYMVCMGLIVGGAFGNISDRLIMAVLEGYGGVLDGHVVDFIYFSLRINGWQVFPYIFNVADVAISAAIISLLIFNKRIFIHPHETESADSTVDAAAHDMPSDSGDNTVTESRDTGS